MTTNANHQNDIDEIHSRVNLQKIKPIKKRAAITKTISLAVLLLVAMIVPFVAISQKTTSVAASSDVSATSSLDYQLWVQPYLSQLEKIRAVLMTPYTIGIQHYGYDSTFGLVRGGNIEPSPAIKVTAGYQDVIVAIDNNLEGSYSLDYFNSANSVLSTVAGWQYQPTNIYGNDRAILAKPWDGIGACTSPFEVYNYPSSFALLDRREAEYGFIGPYASTLESPGNHLGGIGSNCGTSGQTWFLPGYTNPNTTPSQPLIVTVFPSSQPLGTTGDLEELSFYIDQMYMQCQNGIQASCSQWRASYLNAMSQFPFGAPREALHFIQVTRATVAWNDHTLTYKGLTAEQMLQSTISQVFSQAIGPHGGLAQSWGGSGDQTPEPNFQAMVAFDPRMPSWFDLGASTTTSHSTTSTTTSHSTSTSATSSDSTSATTSQSTTSTGVTSTSTTPSKTSTSSQSSSSTTGSTSTANTTTSIDSTITSSNSSLPSSSATTTISSTATSATSVSTQSSTTAIHSTQTASSQSATNVTTSVANGSSTTVRIATIHSASPVSAVTPSGLESAIVNQPAISPTVLGGFTVFEVFMVGLTPLLILSYKGRLGVRKTFRGWQW